MRPRQGHRAGGLAGSQRGTSAGFHGLVTAPLPVLVYEPVVVVLLLGDVVIEVGILGKMEDEGIIVIILEVLVGESAGLFKALS